MFIYCTYVQAFLNVCTLTLTCCVLFYVATTSTQTLDIPMTTSIPTTSIVSTSLLLSISSVSTTTTDVPIQTVATTSPLSPTVNATIAAKNDDDLLLEAIIPAVVVVIIIILFVLLIGWCYWRRTASRKNRRYRSESNYTVDSCYSYQIQFLNTTT